MESFQLTRQTKENDDAEKISAELCRGNIVLCSDGESQHESSSGIGAVIDYYLTIDSHYPVLAQQSANYIFSSSPISDGN